MPDIVYLDHAATTPLDSEVLDAMMPFLRDNFGSASTLFSIGREARDAVEDGARIEVAYVRVPQDPALEEWARAYLESAGLEVLRYQTGAFSGRAVFDTLLKAPADYKVRMTFSRHGDKIYIVSGSAPVPAYEKFMRIFGVAAVSFSLL